LYFDKLQEIQEALSKLTFVEEIELSKPLRQFVRDCDRLDDIWLRKRLYNEIKNDKYILNSDLD